MRSPELFGWDFSISSIKNLVEERHNALHIKYLPPFPSYLMRRLTVNIELGLC